MSPMYKFWALALLLLTASASAEFVLPDQSSEVYYRYAAVGGDGVEVGGGAEVAGDLHSNGDIELASGSRVVGDASAVEGAEGEGEVVGGVVEGAPIVALPELFDIAEIAARADRVFDDDVTFRDEVIDDVVFVDGKVNIRGSLNGVGTVVATRDIVLQAVGDGDSDEDSDSESDGDSAGDSDSEGGPEGASFVLTDGSRIALISSRTIRLGEGRGFRGVLRASRDVKLEAGVAVKGVVVADRKVKVGEDAIVTFLQLDAAPPGLTVLTPADGSILPEARPEIVADFVDDFSGVDLDTLELLLDDVDRLPAATVSESDLSLILAEPLGDGLHTLEVAVRDRAGNESRSVLSFTTDTALPVLVIESPADGSFLTTPTVDVTGTVSDLTPLLAVRVNGQPATIAGPGFAAPVVLTQGINTLAVTATDSVGLQTVAVTAVTLDTEPPELTLLSPVPGQVTNNPTVRFVGEVEDTVGVGSLTIDGLPVEVLAGRFETDVPLPEGLSVVPVRAEDLAGNVAEFLLDVRRLSVPQISIFEPVDYSVVSSETVEVHGTVSDPGVAVVVNGVVADREGEAFSATVPVADDRNVLDVVAIAASGGRAAAKATVFRDGAAPRVAIYDPTDGAIVHRTPVSVRGLVHEIAGEAVAGEVAVSINGLPAETSHGSFLVAELDLVPGQNALTVEATDASGNVGTSTVTVTFEPPARSSIEVNSGGLQEAAIGETLSEPLIARLLDGAGAPVEGRPVVFRITDGDGRFDDGSRLRSVTSDATGRAAVNLTLGSRAGPGSQRVEATAAGFAGKAVFLASVLPGPAAEVYVDGGSRQIGATGQLLPDPMVAVVTDRGFNRLANVPVSFQLVEGQGVFTNGLTTMEVLTDGAGRARAKLRLGPDEGVSNNVVEARLAEDLPETGFATFVASALASGDPALTAIRGVVLDNSDQPVPGVTVRIAGDSAVTETDTQGVFALAPVAVGTLHLEIDGSTAARPGIWPRLDFEITTVAGRENKLSRPVYLLPLDVERGLAVSETEGGSLSLPELPGFSLEIAPGSVTFPNGSRSGIVSATQVHADKVPMTPVFGQQPRFVVTIQPSGAKFDPPARLQLPNVDGLAPGQVTELFSFDHDLGSFVSIGPGRVTEDGITVASLPGVGVVEAGWHHRSRPETNGTPHDCPQCKVCDGRRCVPGCRFQFEEDSAFSPPKDGTVLPKSTCPCSDGDRCTVDRCSNGKCVSSRKVIGRLDAEVNGKKFVDVLKGTGVVFNATAQHAHCNNITYQWKITSNSGHVEFASGTTLSRSFSEPDIYIAEVTANCDNGCSRRKNVVVVSAYEVQIKLEKQGPTQISDDGRYSEDTTVLVSAVRSDTGAPLHDFVGTVEIEEVSLTSVYTQNGGFLPTSVPLSFSGQNFFVAKSLAGPISENGDRPDPALITTANFPLFGADFLEIEQWVDEGQIDPFSRGSVYDWVEARAVDLLAGARSPVIDVLTAIENYSMITPGGALGEAPQIHSASVPIKINPHFLAMRLNSAGSPICGQTKLKLFNNVFVHEARHAYIFSLSTVDLTSPDAIPGSPNNDDDQDFLLDTVPVPPSDIVLDTNVFRNVCRDTDSLIFPARYSGDASPDVAATGFAFEMDAHVFDSSNVN